MKDWFLGLTDKVRVLIAILLWYLYFAIVYFFDDSTSVILIGLAFCSAFTFLCATIHDKNKKAKEKAAQEEAKIEEHERQAETQNATQNSPDNASAPGSAISEFFQISFNGQRKQDSPSHSENSNRLYSKVSVIDFETATGESNSACSVGIAVIENGIITESVGYLIQPPDNYYSASNVKIHGITNDMTLDEPTFPEIWDKIKHFFVDSCIAAHNASFDMGVLKSCLLHYGIDTPEFEYANTLYIADDMLRGTPHTRKLDDLCNLLGIEFVGHHNAECDAVATAKLIIAAFEHSKCADFSKFVDLWLMPYGGKFSDVSAPQKRFVKFQHAISVKDINDGTSVNDEKDADFDGKGVCFTGDLQHMSREEAMSAVVSRGGIVKSGVTKKCDILVNANPSSVSTTKVTKALELQASGHPIVIVDEDTFLRMLADNEAVVV